MQRFEDVPRQEFDNYIKGLLSRQYLNKSQVMEYFEFIVEFCDSLELRLKKSSGNLLRSFLLYIEPIFRNLISINKRIGFTYQAEGELRDQVQSLKDDLLIYIKTKSTLAPFSVIISRRTISRFELIQKLTSITFMIYEFKNEFDNSIITNRTQNERFFDFYNFYNPDISNKTIVVDLVNEAIELINSDDFLSLEAKNKIVNRLLGIIDELHRKDTNWSGVFGKIKEAIIVLGALGSLAGGVYAITDAATKLEEAEKIIQETSINTNFFIEENVTNVFVNKPIRKIPQLTPPVKDENRYVAISAPSENPKKPYNKQ